VHVFSRPNYPQLRSSRDLSQDNRVARWDRVTPDVWQDTLSLICDRYAAVRLEYTNALAYYISHKLPTYGNCPDPNGTKRAQKLADGPLLPATKTSVSSSWRCHKQDFEHIARLFLPVLSWVLRRRRRRPLILPPRQLLIFPSHKALRTKKT